MRVNSSTRPIQDLPYLVGRVIRYSLVWVVHLIVWTVLVIVGTSLKVKSKLYIEKVR